MNSYFAILKRRLLNIKSCIKSDKKWKTGNKANNEYYRYILTTTTYKEI